MRVEVDVTQEIITHSANCGVTSIGVSKDSPYGKHCVIAQTVKELFTLDYTVESKKIALVHLIKTNRTYYNISLPKEVREYIIEFDEPYFSGPNNKVRATRLATMKPISFILDIPEKLEEYVDLQGIDDSSTLRIVTKEQ